MFLVALGLTVNEAVFHEGDRPFLLTLFASMMGLPIILAGEKKKDNGSE